MRLPSGSILAQYLKRSGVAGHGIECELRSVRRGFRVPQSVVGAAGLEALLPSARYVSDERHCMSAWAMPSSNGRGDHAEKEKISVIGSGNWGSVAAKLVATNARSRSCFHDEVRMWVFEETLASGEKLTDVINKKNENVKYLPNVNLGWNVIADSSLENTGSSGFRPTIVLFSTPEYLIALQSVSYCLMCIRFQKEPLLLGSGANVDTFCKEAEGQSEF